MYDSQQTLQVERPAIWFMPTKISGNLQMVAAACIGGNTPDRAIQLYLSNLPFEMNIMKIRRLVTGHDNSGNSIFVADDLAPRSHVFASIPGHAMAQIWTTQSSPKLPDVFEDPTTACESLIPPVGGTSIAIFDFPPDEVMQNPNDLALAHSEFSAAIPGLIECFEANEPGMHATPTIDYGVILEGELWLELDNGECRLVKAGDVVIQNGTRHAWRNRSTSVARALFVMIGADDARIKRAIS